MDEVFNDDIGKHAYNIFKQITDRISEKKSAVKPGDSVPSSSSSVNSSNRSSSSGNDTMHKSIERVDAMPSTCADNDSYRDVDENSVDITDDSLEGSNYSNDDVVSDDVDVHDEWENDDDDGYVPVEYTEDDFFKIEEESAGEYAFLEDVVSSKSWFDAATIIRKKRYIDNEITVNNSRRSDDHNCYSTGGEGDGGNDSEEDDEERSVTASLEQDLATAEAYLQSDDVDQLAHLLDQGDFASTQEHNNKRNSLVERRRSEIMGQCSFLTADSTQQSYFNLKIITSPYKTGFEESKSFNPPLGTVIAGRYEVSQFLGNSAFSVAIQCLDLIAVEGENDSVCLKVIKNNKDFFDQSLDEIKLLQYINSRGDPDRYNVLQLIDYFYTKEHLFIVSELLKENLYEFGKYIRDNAAEPYYTIPRLKYIMKQVLEAIAFIHSLNLIHCDIKPENIVMKSYSRCEVKLIDFGSSCFTTDSLTTYIQSRSYRAPEVILGHAYDERIDMWSVGAVLAELHTGYVLFQNDSVPSMLSRITAIVGEFPENVLVNGRDTAKYFTLSNNIYECTDDGKYMYLYPKKTTLRERLHIDESDDSIDSSLFVGFVEELLRIDPERRTTANKALQHQWLQDIPQIEPYAIVNYSNDDCVDNDDDCVSNSNDGDGNDISIDNNDE